MRHRLFNLSGVFAEEGFNPASADIFDFVNLEGTNCLCSEESASVIREKTLPLPQMPFINWIDTGDYHHVTAISTSSVDEDFAVVHLDHHPDMEESPYPGSGILSCGGWLREAFTSNDRLCQVLAVGINPDLELEFLDLMFDGVFAITEEELNNPGELKEGLQMIDPELPVYLSIDLDVLSPDEFKTDWDQGRMTASQLEFIMKDISSRHRILGIDICGGLTRSKGAADADLELNLAFREKLTSIIDGLF